MKMYIYIWIKDTNILFKDEIYNQKQVVRGSL